MIIHCNSLETEESKNLRRCLKKKEHFRNNLRARFYTPSITMKGILEEWYTVDLINVSGRLLNLDCKVLLE